MNRKMKIGIAADRYGRTIAGLRAWIARWNQQHPEMPVRRHPGFVDEADLARAMAAWERQHTPALRVAASLSSTLTVGRQ